MTNQTRNLLIVLGLAALLLGASKVSGKLKSLIAGEEGLRLTVYKDTGGVWTIGYGHKVLPGDNIYPYGATRTISQAKADELFAADTKIATDAVKKYVRVPINDNQRAALTSLAFNIGAGAFANSTLVKALNAGDVKKAADEFRRWNKDNGVEVKGLTARRERERGVFLA